MEERVKMMMDALQKESEDFHLSPLLRQKIITSAKQLKRRSAAPAGPIRARWMLAATLLFLFSTGFASVKWYEMKNREGETVQEYQAAPPLSKERLSELQQMQAEREKLQNMLEQGTAAAIYQVKADGESDFFFVENPLTITKLDTLQSRVKDLVRFPENVAQTYSFVRASLSYDYEKDNSLGETLKKKARETKQGLVIQPVKSLPSISHVSAEYQDKAGNTVRINLLKKFWTGKAKVTVPGVHDAVEKVRLDGLDGLYSERVDPFGKPRKVVDWNDGEWSLSINSTDESMTKDQLLEIANQIRQKGK